MEIYIDNECPTILRLKITGTFFVNKAYPMASSVWVPKQSTYKQKHTCTSHTQKVFENEKKKANEEKQT